MFYMEKLEKYAESHDPKFLFPPRVTVDVLFVLALFSPTHEVSAEDIIVKLAAYLPLKERPEFAKYIRSKVKTLGIMELTRYARVEGCHKYYRLSERALPLIDTLMNGYQDTFKVLRPGVVVFEPSSDLIELVLDFYRAREDDKVFPPLFRFLYGLNFYKTYGYGNITKMEIRGSSIPLPEMLMQFHQYPHEVLKNALLSGWFKKNDLGYYLPERSTLLYESYMKAAKL